ncbi:MAG: amidohydrolase [Acidimicrobiia bacterium]|nr:amidohydrolase [Acidimicrobiia bacterium]
MKITEWAIDCDTHITEPGDVWTSRLPARFADRAPHMVRTPEGRDEWRFGGYERPVPVGATAVAGWPEPFPSMPQNMDEIPAAAHDAKARLALMDEIGVWACALYPNIGGFGNEGFLGLGDPELMLACVRAYNDWLIEWTDPDPRRFIPIMATPFWDIDATVTEIRRAAEAGHRGILFTGEPQAYGLPVLGDGHWDPLWSLACELDLSVNFHIGSADFTSDFDPARLAAHGAGPTLVRTSVRLFLGNAEQVTDLVMSGVLPRYPDLRVVTVESGIGWLGFLIEAMDYCASYSSISTERPAFAKKPSEYLAEQVYACFFFEQDAPGHVIERLGRSDRLLWETDYPHPVCLHGDVRGAIDASLGDLDAVAQRQILFDNAAELYRVPAPDRPWAPG